MEKLERKEKGLGGIMNTEGGEGFVEGGFGSIPMQGFKRNALLPESVKILAFHYGEMGKDSAVTVFIKVGEEF